MNRGVIEVIFVIICSFAIFHAGAIYGAKKTAHVWTDYICEKCVRLDLLTSALNRQFEFAKESAPEGAPVVADQETILKIISAAVENQNRGR